MVVVVFNHNVLVRFVNRLKAISLSRSHLCIIMATAAVTKRHKKIVDNRGLHVSICVPWTKHAGAAPLAASRLGLITG